MRIFECRHLLAISATFAMFLCSPSPAHAGANNGSMADTKIPTDLSGPDDALVTRLATVPELQRFPRELLPLIASYVPTRSIVHPVGPHFLWVRNERSGTFVLADNPGCPITPELVSTRDYRAFADFLASKGEGFLATVDDVMLEFIVDGPHRHPNFWLRTVSAWIVSFTTPKGKKRIAIVQTLNNEESRTDEFDNAAGLRSHILVIEPAKGKVWATMFSTSNAGNIFVFPPGFAKPIQAESDHGDGRKEFHFSQALSLQSIWPFGFAILKEGVTTRVELCGRFKRASAGRRIVVKCGINSSSSPPLQDLKIVDPYPVYACTSANEAVSTVLDTVKDIARDIRHVIYLGPSGHLYTDLYPSLRPDERRARQLPGVPPTRAMWLATAPDISYLLVESYDQDLRCLTLEASSSPGSSSSIRSPTSPPVPAYKIEALVQANIWSTTRREAQLKAGMQLP